MNETYYNHIINYIQHPINSHRLPLQTHILDQIYRSVNLVNKQLIDYMRQFMIESSATYCLI